MKGKRIIYVYLGDLIRVGRDLHEIKKHHNGCLFIEVNNEYKFISTIDIQTIFEIYRLTDDGFKRIFKKKHPYDRYVNTFVLLEAERTL